jgi:hypothetical protein
MNHSDLIHSKIIDENKSKGVEYNIFVAVIIYVS